MTEKVEDQEVKDPPESEIKDSPTEDSAVVEVSPEEQKAEGFGWMPKEKWVEAGKSEDEWVPAKQFLKFGEVKQQLISKEKQLTKQEKIIKLMKNHHMRVQETAFKEALKQLRSEREAALEENDFAKAEKLRDRIEQTKEYANTEAKKLPPEIEQEMQEVGNIGDPPPEFYEFSSRNPWYVSEPTKQDEFSKEADVVGYAFVQKNNLSGKSVTAAEVYNHVEKYMKRAYPEKFGTPKSPQTDTSPRSGSERSSPSSKLSSAEVEIAKAFGLTEKQYIDEQKKYRGR